MKGGETESEVENLNEKCKVCKCNRTAGECKEKWKKF